MKHKYSLYTEPFRRFAFSRPTILDPQEDKKYPNYVSIIYEISGVRKKWGQQINSWPPGDYMMGEIMLSIISTLIQEGYKGKVEVRVPWYVSHNIISYVMSRHKEPTKLYKAFYNPYDKAYELARENGIDCMELTDNPPEDNKIKTYYPRYTRTKRGQKPKLVKNPPADNIPEEPPKTKRK